jgi:hypothetical protein
MVEVVTGPPALGRGADDTGTGLVEIGGSMKDGKVGRGLANGFSGGGGAGGAP